MAIYTRSGDTGETSFFDGSRVGKSDRRIDFLGSLDELNSFIGLLTSSITFEIKEKGFLYVLQVELLNIGAEIANPKIIAEKFKDYSELVKELETHIDLMTKELPSLQNFILPGGSIPSSYAHICRTVTRKCERKFFSLKKEDTVNETLGKWINRLSDYFFTLARFLNKESGENDILWNSQ